MCDRVKDHEPYVKLRLVGWGERVVCGGGEWEVRWGGGGGGGVEAPKSPGRTDVETQWRRELSVTGARFESPTAQLLPGTDRSSRRHPDNSCHSFSSVSDLSDLCVVFSVMYSHPLPIPAGVRGAPTHTHTHTHTRTHARTHARMHAHTQTHTHTHTHTHRLTHTHTHTHTRMHARTHTHTNIHTHTHVHTHTHIHTHIHTHTHTHRGANRHNTSNIMTATQT